MCDVCGYSPTHTTIYVESDTYPGDTYRFDVCSEVCEMAVLGEDL